MLSALFERGGHRPTPTPSVFLAESDNEIASCYQVMAELRPHIPREDFVERVKRQAAQGYLLAGLCDEERVVSVAGFRMAENLAWGRYLYVDDLVTAAEHRSKGYGDMLFDWLVEFARLHHRDELHLDSGVHRFGAHRFYLRRRMDITSHHFAMQVPAA